MKKKKEASSAIGYVIIFGIAIIMVILTMFMIEKAKLMTHQHDIDDALADSVLASLVADDVYYFETYETTGSPVIRFRDQDESYKNYVECMDAAIGNTSTFYYNVEYSQFILYEVEGSTVTKTTYTGNAAVKQTTTGILGKVTTPEGEVVKGTSAYGKVTFDIKSILNGTYIRKSRDLYATLEIDN